MNLKDVFHLNPKPKTICLQLDNSVAELQKRCICLARLYPCLPTLFEAVPMHGHVNRMRV